jgi:hypothetical protein
MEMQTTPNSQALTTRQAAILLQRAETGVRRSVTSGRWPATFNGTQWLIEPGILVERWALELTHGWLGPDTRKRLAALAIAAGYPLDVDALQKACERHLKQKRG